MPDLRTTFLGPHTKHSIRLVLDQSQLDQILAAIKALAPQPPHLTPAQQQALDRADAKVLAADAAINKFDSPPAPSSK